MDSVVDHHRSSHYAQNFGDRTIVSHLTRVVPGKTHGPNGYRQFVLNGVPIVIRGGGWSQDVFLRNTAVPRREPAWRDARRNPAGTSPTDHLRVKVARIQEVNKQFRR